MPGVGTTPVQKPEVFELFEMQSCASGWAENPDFLACLDLLDKAKSGLSDERALDVLCRINMSDPMRDHFLRHWLNDQGAGYWRQLWRNDHPELRPHAAIRQGMLEACKRFRSRSGRVTCRYRWVWEYDRNALDFSVGVTEARIEDSGSIFSRQDDRSGADRVVLVLFLTPVPEGYVRLEEREGPGPQQSIPISMFLVRNDGKAPRDEVIANPSLALRMTIRGEKY